MQVSERDVASGLSISELAERTGVPSATLRSWETRYGFPSPQRLPGGHRRYHDQDVVLVEEVLRLRASGLSLPTAVDLAAAGSDRAEPSVFAGLRRRHAELTPQVMRKTTLLALTRAIEDECCARAANPVLFASFQRQHFYRRSVSRWAELSRTAHAVVVFADFPEVSTAGALPLEVPVPVDAPLRREWIVVCDAADHPACLAGWEHPGQDGVADADRRFEALWTVDPRVVRDAARICARLTQEFAPDHDRELPQLLAGTTPTASADLKRASSLLNRMVGYVEASTAR